MAWFRLRCQHFLGNRGVNTRTVHLWIESTTDYMTVSRSSSAERRRISNRQNDSFLESAAYAFSFGVDAAWYAADIIIVFCRSLMCQSFRSNSVANQSSNSGWVGGSPAKPKLLDRTIPRPKWYCQIRFARTRAVSGLSADTIPLHGQAAYQWSVHFQVVRSPGQLPLRPMETPAQQEVQETFCVGVTAVEDECIRGFGSIFGHNKSGWHLAIFDFSCSSCCTFSRHAFRSFFASSSRACSPNSLIRR